MKQSLYELSQHYVKALDFLTDPENEIDDQTAIDTIESLDGDLDDKIANIARVIATLEHQAEGINAVANRQRDRAKSLLTKADWLRDYLKHNMQATGHDKVEALDISVKLAKTPASVKIIDEGMIPEEFWRIKTERLVDKTGISNCIKNGGIVPGASLENKFRVSIK